MIRSTPATQKGPSCRDWLSWTPAQQTSFTRQTVGTVNLVLRMRGETGVCWMAVHQNGVGSESAAEQLKGIASSWPDPVQVDLAHLPKTQQPDDRRNGLCWRDRQRLAHLLSRSQSC